MGLFDFFKKKENSVNKPANVNLEKKSESRLYEEYDAGKVGTDVKELKKKATKIKKNESAIAAYNFLTTELLARKDDLNYSQFLSLANDRLRVYKTEQDIEAINNIYKKFEPNLPSLYKLEMVDHHFRASDNLGLDYFNQIKDEYSNDGEFLLKLAWILYRHKHLELAFRQLSSAGVKNLEHLSFYEFFLFHADQNNLSQSICHDEKKYKAAFQYECNQHTLRFIASADDIGNLSFLYHRDFEGEYSRIEYLKKKYSKVFVDSVNLEAFFQEWLMFIKNLPNSIGVQKDWINYRNLVEEFRVSREKSSRYKELQDWMIESLKGNERTHPDIIHKNEVLILIVTKIQKLCSKHIYQTK